jgi:uncharacterized membrane protein YhiD involved in acid resistance
VLGALIGAERQYRQRTAGLRTNVLVAVGAAAFVDLAMHLAGNDGAVRVIAYVVSGIGFLGAGVIMKQGLDVRGLNTAATLWASAAVGSCAGADMIAQAAALTVFVLAGNTLLRPLVNAINRFPLDEQSSEATYQFKLAVTPEALPDMRDRLVEGLEKANYRMLTSSSMATNCWRSLRRSSARRSIRQSCRRLQTICSGTPACAMPPGKSAPGSAPVFEGSASRNLAAHQPLDRRNWR